MPVAHLSIPTSRTGVLTIAALAHGVEVESVDFTPGDDTMYVDATGTGMNLVNVIKKTGAAYHGITNYVESALVRAEKNPAKPGHSGEGVANEVGQGREVYGNLMGRPKYDNE